MVTANDYRLRIFNGGTGVVLNGTDGLRAVIAGAGGALDFASSRLSDVETMHAMTIHKARGSHADEVTVLLPEEEFAVVDAEFSALRSLAPRKGASGWDGASVRGAIERRALRTTGLRFRLEM